METSLIRTSSIGGGDFSIFLNRPIALVLFALSALVILGPYIVKGVSSLGRGSATRGR